MTKDLVDLPKFAEQLRQTEFQENRWLRGENEELRRFIWMLVESSGGEIHIPEQVKRMARDDRRFEIIEDVANRTTIVKTKNN